MNTRISKDRTTHLADLQGERGLLKRLLHLTRSKHAQVPALLGRTTITELGGELLEAGLLVVDTVEVAFEDVEGLVFGACDVLLSP